MDIGVGDYVRTNDGRIFRVYKIDNKNSKYTLYSDEFTRPINYKVTKHSKNIIDLIEEGDIIEFNGEKYQVIYDESYNKSSLEFVFEQNKYVTILTKEQYVQNCYTVERS